ncbi:MAG: tetratricopeptide repeat protein [bacterium]
MKKTVLLIVLFFSISLVAYSADKPIKVLLTEAQSALEKADYPTAIELLNGVLAKDSNNIQAHYQRGVAFFYSAYYDVAKIDFEFTVKKNPKFPDAWNFLGLSKSYLGDLEGAMDDFSKAIKLDPKFAEAFLNRGSGYLEQNENDKAFDDFNTAVKLSPKNPEIYLNRGNAYKAKGDLANAVLDYQKATELGIKNVDVYYRMGNCYYQQKKYDDAVKAYSEGLKIEPANVDLLNNRAVALNDGGRIIESKRDKETLKEMVKIEHIPIEQLNFVVRTDTPKMFSLKVPENWFFIEENGVISISDKSGKDVAKSNVIGTINLALHIGDTIGLKDDQVLMQWWDEKQTKSGDNYFHYYFRSKKDKPYRGVYPQKFTKAQLQYTDGSQVFMSYDMAIAYGGNLFHINFQFPEEEMDYYDQIIEKIVTSVGLTFTP